MISKPILIIWPILKIFPYPTIVFPINSPCSIIILKNNHLIFIRIG